MSRAAGGGGADPARGTARDISRPVAARRCAHGSKSDAFKHGTRSGQAIIQLRTARASVLVLIITQLCFAVWLILSSTNAMPHTLMPGRRRRRCPLLSRGRRRHASCRVMRRRRRRGLLAPWRRRRGPASLVLWRRWHTACMQRRPPCEIALGYKSCCSQLGAQAPVHAVLLPSGARLLPDVPYVTLASMHLICVPEHESTARTRCMSAAERAAHETRNPALPQRSLARTLVPRRRRLAGLVLRRRRGRWAGPCGARRRDGLSCDRARRRRLVRRHGRRHVVLRASSTLVTVPSRAWCVA